MTELNDSIAKLVTTQLEQKRRYKGMYEQFFAKKTLMLIQEY